MCCLNGENLVGSHKNPVFVTYSYKLEADDETAESALSLYCVCLFLQDAYYSMNTSSTAAVGLA